MATILVCPPDTIEDLEAALPVTWIGEPTCLDKLARETVAGLPLAAFELGEWPRERVSFEEPDDAIGPNGEDVYADLEEPPTEFVYDCDTGEMRLFDADKDLEESTHDDDTDDDEPSWSERCPYGNDHDRGVLCDELCGMDEPPPDETIVIATIGPLPMTPWLERRCAELSAKATEEDCVGCGEPGVWELEGELAYPLCPACKAQAAAEAQAEPPPEGWPGDLSDLDLLDPVRMEQIITNARAHFEAGTWPRARVAFGSEE